MYAKDILGDRNGGCGTYHCHLILHFYAGLRVHINNS